NILIAAMPDLKADYPDNFENWQNYIKSYETGKKLKKLPETQSDTERFYLVARQVYSTYFNIKAQEAHLSKFQIRAPYSGIITETKIDKGSLVSPGQLLGTIINNRQYELEAAVPISIASKIKLGDTFTFRSNEVKGEWKGKVSRLNDVIDINTQNLAVYINLSGNGLKAGMYLEGNFQTKEYENVSTISSAILGRDNKVYILNDKTIMSKEVEPLEFLSDSIVVRGLSNSDLLINRQIEIPIEGKKISG
ncbi:MAG: efflux RND transporter periplasmic adaptor subunit, partial [Bacteroidota bacterium]